MIKNSFIRRSFLFWSLFFVFILPLAAHSGVPLSCRYAAGSYSQEKPCNALKRITSERVRGVYADYSNVCLFKSGSWQIGRLVANPGGRHKFEPEISCSGGVVLRTYNPGLAKTIGPKRSEAYQDLQRVTATEAGSGIIFDSSNYYTASTNGLSLRGYDVNNQVIVSCVAGPSGGKPCSNAAEDSSVNAINFCAPKDLGNVGVKVGKNTFKGSWYVRYTLENQGSFEVCPGGVIVANAQVMANKNNTPVTLLTQSSTIDVSTLMQSYNDGRTLTSGLINWYAPARDSSALKKYRGVAACVVTSGTTITRHSCEKSVLNVNTAFPDESSSVAGYCYAAVDAPGVRYETGDGLVNCNQVDITRKRVVSPSD